MFVGGTIRYFKYNNITKTWLSGSTVTTGENTNNSSLQWIGVNNEIIMVLIMRNSDVANFYKSSDGATWTVTGGSYPIKPIVSASNGLHIVWLNNYIHFIFHYGGNTFYYRRIDPIANTWNDIATAPSWPDASTDGIENFALMYANKSTTELYLGLIDNSNANTDKITLFKSTDAGNNWSTMCLAESLGTAWNNVARCYRSTGLTIGSDNLLHIWGADRQFGGDPAYSVYTMTRDLVDVGTYGVPELVDICPNNGSRSAAGSGFSPDGNIDHWPIQRQDGIHDRPFDFCGMWYTTSQLSAGLGFNELLVVSSVDPQISRIIYPISDNPPDDDFGYTRNYVPQYPFHDDSVY